MRLPRPVVHVLLVAAVAAGALAGVRLFAFFGGG